jgi:hypothetical protein
MNSDTSLAAWMIAGGPRTIDPADGRNLAHRRELAAFHRATAGPGLRTRISTVLATLRLTPAEPQAACCPA